jgi:hypothetical protein
VKPCQTSTKKKNDFFENLPLNSAIHKPPSELLDELECHIVETAKEVASTETKKRPDWFTDMEPLLTNLINERNQAYKSFLKHPSEVNHQMLKDARKLLLREKRRAKRQWQFTFAERCRREDFISNPKEAWSMIFKLMEGFQGHHKTHMPRNFKTKTGKEAKGDKENAQILIEHFHSLFNSETEVDITVLDGLSQYKIAHELDGTPTRSEVLNAIKKNGL